MLVMFSLEPSFEKYYLLWALVQLSQILESLRPRLFRYESFMEKDVSLDLAQRALVQIGQIPEAWPSHSLQYESFMEKMYH